MSILFLVIERGIRMKKVKMQLFSTMLFEAESEKRFLYCRQRNFSEETLICYRASDSLQQGSRKSTCVPSLSWL